MASVEGNDEPLTISKMKVPSANAVVKLNAMSGLEKTKEEICMIPEV